MKLLEARGEEAITLLADLLEPISIVCQDKEFLHCIETGQKSKAIKYAMKNNPKAILEIAAICEGVPVDEYQPFTFELAGSLLKIMNHPDVSKLFTSQARMKAPNSGSATETTTEQSQ